MILAALQTGEVGYGGAAVVLRAVYYAGSLGGAGLAFFAMLFGARQEMADAARTRRWATGAAMLGITAGVGRDRRTIGGRSVLALNGVAPAVIFGDCIRVQIPASSSFASIWLKATVEKYAGYPTCGFFSLNLSWSRMFRPPLVRRSQGGVHIGIGSGTPSRRRAATRVLAFTHVLR